MTLRALLQSVLVLVILPAVIVACMLQEDTLTYQQASPMEPYPLEEPAPSWGGAPIDGEKVPFEVAQTRIPWTIPVPAYRIGDVELVETWVSYENYALDYRQVYLIYSNGLEISIWPEEIQPDFSRWEPPFQQITVHGKPGAGTDPGTLQIEGHGENKYSGAVTWWENRLVINIYGDFPMVELLKVAESMPEPVWISGN